MKLTPVVTDGIRLYFNEVTTAGLMICQVPTHSAGAGFRGATDPRHLTDRRGGCRTGGRPH
ncbi:MAG: hypothetical protein WBW33_15985, partial [Bryobacteraceae bacterium]